METARCRCGQWVCEYCFLKYGEKLYASAWALLSPPYNAHYRDAVHDAFIDFQVAVERGRLRCLSQHGDSEDVIERASPACYHYLMAILIAKCARVIKREAKQMKREINYCRDRGSRLAKPADECCMVQEMRGLVRDALEQLPESQGGVLTLREFGGLIYQAIGEALDLKPATVEKRLYRSRQQLRLMLAQKAGVS